MDKQLGILGNICAPNGRRAALIN